MDNNDLLNLLRELDPDEARELIAEYQSLTSEAGLRQFVEKKTAAKREEKAKTVNLEELNKQYQAEIEAASRNRVGATQIANIKAKYRRQGLNVW
jgi:hypothetical protein